MRNSESGFTKVIFDLEPDSWHGFSTESLWASKLPSGDYQLENSPFFAKGVSHMDAVVTKCVSDERKVIKIGTRSGHSTYRILVSSEHNSDLFNEMWEPLEYMGCTYEHGDFGYQLYSVDVPKTADIEIAYRLLELGEDKKAWSFEEAHYGHPR